MTSYAPPVRPPKPKVNTSQPPSRRQQARSQFPHPLPEQLAVGLISRPLTEEETGDISNCAPHELDAVRQGMSDALLIIDRTLAVLEGRCSSDVSEEAIAYFLGDIGPRTQELKDVLTAAHENILRLSAEPERYTCDTEEDHDAGATFHQGDYTFKPRFFSKQKDASSRTRRALALVHEAIHEVFHEQNKRYIAQRANPDTSDSAVLPRRLASDYSSAEGVLGVLPNLPGVDPLGNPDSIASVVAAIGFGDFRPLKTDAEEDLAKVSGFDRNETRVLRTVSGYVAYMIITNRRTTFEPTKPRPDLQLTSIMNQLLTEHTIAIRRTPGTPIVELYRTIQKTWFAAAEQMSSIRILSTKPTIPLPHVYVPSPSSRELIARAAAELANSPSQKVPAEFIRPLSIELLVNHLLQSGRAYLTENEFFQVKDPRALLHLVVEKLTFPII